MSQSEDILQSSYRPEILKEMDEFNTAPEFGMLGILQEEEALIRKAERIEREEKEGRDTEDRPASQRQADERDKNAQEDNYKYYAPLNESIQDQRRHTDERLNEFGNRFDRLERAIAESRPQPQYQPPPGYDPEAPIMMSHLEPMERTLRGAHQLTVETALENQRLKAHLMLRDFKTQNPDFALSPQELDQAFNRHVGSDLGRARNINWEGHFTQLHDRTYRPKIQQKLSDLEKENVELKKQLEGRKSTARRESSDSERISPAISSRRSGAVQTPTTAERGGDDDQVLNLRSFQKGKSFKSFAKDVLRLKGNG